MIKKLSIILLVVLFAGLQCRLVMAQKQYLKYKRISLKEGLSQSTVECILKDSRGFMWFGTRDGLNKYDGYKIIVFKHDEESKGSISNNYINDILEDKESNIWIATNKGLNKFDRKTNQFNQFNEDGGPVIIKDLIQDKKGNIWIGGKEGLFLLNPKTGKFTNHSTKKGSWGINKIAEDDQGNLWLATGYGVIRYNYQTKTDDHYLDEILENKEAKYYIRSINKDNKGQIWIGIREDGIAVFDNASQTFVFYKNESENKALNDILSVAEGMDGKLWMGSEGKGIHTFHLDTKTFSSFYYELEGHTIRCIYKDDIGNVWLGSNSGGVIFMPKFGDKFQYYTYNPLNSEGLSNSIVKAILEDSEGNIWIGTESGGLNKMDRKKGTFIQYRNDPANPKSIGADQVLSIAEINKDTLALGLHRGGMDLFIKKRGEFIHHLPVENNSTSLSHNIVASLLKDKKGNLWIGTWKGGINLYNKYTKTFTQYKNNSKDKMGISGDKVLKIYEDAEGYLWIGGDKGLDRFDRKTGEFTHYTHDSKDKTSISDNTIYCIMEDTWGNMWIGTEGGLNLFDRKSRTFKSYTDKDGLPNNVIYGILEDNKANLWLSTNNGLSKFNTESKTIRNFDIEDGLQDNEFKRGAYFKNTKGEMFFGGVNGFNIFNPDSIIDNPHIPPVVLTDFQIFNKSANYGEKDSPLQKHINESKEITLSYRQSVFTFQFVALDFVQPQSNQYAYKLEGFDENWNNVGNSRFATYTNLDPGEYTFKVKASNNDGIWNENGASIKIVITPPFWKTWWFRILAVVVVFGSIFGWYRARINAIKQQKEVLEQQVIQRTAEIVMQKEELEAQAEYLKEANIEIKDSIKAALIIQQSILPSENLIKKYLPESFVLYKPKDVVSGDFYWFDVKDNNIILAAVDCTGHGVSGAFMSINGHHLLNQAIYPYKKLMASEILDRLNEGIIKVMSQEDEDADTQDGMDIALCILDKDKMKLQYAGANNPLYILRNNEIIQVKANRYSIGKSITGKVNKFTNNEVEIQKGDTLYIFSDGYADQLGGDGESQKFMYNRFREMLLKIGNESMEKQVQVINQALEDWKGSIEQLDDILVLGFKV